MNGKFRKIFDGSFLAFFRRFAILKEKNEKDGILMSNIKIGWSEISITPDKKISLVGQFAERISQYVEKPLMATLSRNSTSRPSSRRFLGTSARITARGLAT